MIRKFEGDEVVEKLNKAVSEVFLNESKSLNLLIDFFSLLDLPKEDSINIYPFYSLENRKIHVIKNTKDLVTAIKSLKLVKLVGFDSEQRPTFKKNETSH